VGRSRLCLHCRAGCTDSLYRDRGGLARGYLVSRGRRSACRLERPACSSISRSRCRMGCSCRTFREAPLALAHAHRAQALHLRNRAAHVERHQQPMSALYVDAVAPDRWRRPTSEISLITAHAYLEDAANDYSGKWDRYTNPSIYKPDDPELYNALENWPGRPIILPFPERPSLPDWLIPQAFVLTTEGLRPISTLASAATRVRRLTGMVAREATP
jgi:hypothetical protein